MVYEVEFKCEGFEYDYEIDAVTGAVLKSGKEPDNDYVPPQTDTAQPETGSSSQTGGNAPQTDNSSSPANNGNTPQTNQSPGQASSEDQNSKASYISEEQAKNAALSHAGVSANAITAYESDLDREHGIMVYDIDFKCEGFEYD